MENKKFALIGIQCNELMFGGVFDTIEQAHDKIVEIVKDAYSDWYYDQYEEGCDTTIEDYIENRFESPILWNDDGSYDGMRWNIMESKHWK